MSRKSSLRSLGILRATALGQQRALSSQTSQIQFAGAIESRALGRDAASAEPFALPLIQIAVEDIALVVSRPLGNIEVARIVDGDLELHPPQARWLIVQRR